MKPLTIRIKNNTDMSGTKYYWFTINGGNGHVLATSEMYTKKHNVSNTIDRVFCDLIYAEVIDET